MLLYKHTFFVKSNKQADKMAWWHRELKANVIIDKSLKYEKAPEGDQQVIKNFVVDFSKYFGIEDDLREKIDLEINKNGLRLQKNEDFLIISPNQIKFKEDWLEGDNLIFRI